MAEHDEARIELLYRRHGAVIYARCLRILQDEDSAKDAMQETFVRVWRHLEDAPDGPTARFWIYRIATNLCLDQQRSRARAVLREDPFEKPSARSVDEALTDRQLASHLIHRAAPQLRAVAFLRYVDGLSPEEVARVLGITRRTVDKRLIVFLEGARKAIKRET